MIHRPEDHLTFRDHVEHYDKEEELKHHLGLSYAQIDKMRDNLQREYASKCFAPPAFPFQLTIGFALGVALTLTIWWVV